jgi:hypothetical protein
MIINESVGQIRKDESHGGLHTRVNIARSNLRTLRATRNPECGGQGDAKGDYLPD